MSKKWLILVFIIILAAEVGTGIYFYNKNKSSTPSKTINLPVSPLPTNTKTLTYQDESGFNFAYPDNYKISSNNLSDNTYYSDLDVTKGNSVINISIKDTTYKTTDDWVKLDTNAPKGAILQGAVSLSGVQGRQYIDNNKIFTVAIDQGVLYIITGTKDASRSVYDGILTSFAFGQAPTLTGSSDSQGSDSNVIYDSEEVVQ